MSRRLAASWKQLTALGPCARSSHKLSAFGGKAYLFGGEGIARHAIDSTVHVLDTKADSWTAISSPVAAPTPRVGHAQCSVRGDLLLVFGGRTDVDMGEGNLDDTWLFDAGAATWTQLLDLKGEPPAPRSFHCATAAGDSVFIFAGCGAAGRLADLHELDLATQRWTAMPPPPDLAGRGGATFEASSDGRSLWVCAGFAGEETNDLLRFDLATRQWERVPSGWLQPRSVSASFSLAHPSGPALFLFGGEVAPSDKGHEGAGGFASDLIAIDGISGARIHLAFEGGPKPEARGWAAAAALSPTEAVLFGGLSGSDESPVRMKDVWLLSVAEPMA